MVGNGGVVTVPASSEPLIAPDGTLSVRLPGTPAPSVIDRIKLVDPPPAGLHKDPAGLFRTADAVDTSPTVRLRSGALESANVDPERGLVELIEQSRGFEVNAKLLGSARDMDEAGARLMRFDQ